jgi:YggT family protein
LVLFAFQLLLFARVILSWVGHRLPEGFRPIIGLVYATTQPVVRIFAPLVPPLRVGAVALDVSILLVFVLLSVLLRAIC